jgi:hypothetical protein
VRHKIRVEVQSLGFAATPDSPSACGFNEKLPHGCGDIDEADSGSSLDGRRLFRRGTVLKRFGGNRRSDDGRGFLQRGFVQLRVGG